VERQSAGTVLFSHGHQSGPDGQKIRALRPTAETAGWTTESIDYRDLRDAPAERAERLVERIDALDGPIILVGSSMGGWVSMAAAEARNCAGLFLMAPALFLEHRVPDAPLRQSYQPKTDAITIVHGWSDEIIPWRNSLRFARQLSASLHLLDSDHRLEDAIADLKTLLARFLNRQSPGGKPEGRPPEAAHPEINSRGYTQ